MHPAVMNSTRQAHKPAITATFGFLLPVCVDKTFFASVSFSHPLILHMGFDATAAVFDSTVNHRIILLFLGQPLYLWESESRSAARTMV